MEYKVFNQGLALKPGRTFLLVDPTNPNKKMRIPPKATAKVPDNFVGDITFRMAVASGELVIWNVAKEVDKLLKESEAEKPAKPSRTGGRNGKKAKEEIDAQAETSGEESSEASANEAEG